MTLLFFISKQYQPSANNRQTAVYLWKDGKKHRFYLRIATSKLGVFDAYRTARTRRGETFLNSIDDADL